MKKIFIFIVLFIYIFSSTSYKWTPIEVTNEIAGFNDYTYTLYDLDNLISNSYQNKYDSELKKINKNRHIFPVLVIIYGTSSPYTISDILSNIVENNYYLDNNIIMVYSMETNTFDCYTGYNIKHDYSSLSSKKINNMFYDAKNKYSDSEKIILTVLEKINSNLKSSVILAIFIFLIFMIIFAVIIYFLYQYIKKNYHRNQDNSQQQYIPVQQTQYPVQQNQYGTFQQQPQQVYYPNQGVNVQEGYNQGDNQGYNQYNDKNYY